MRCSGGWCRGSTRCVGHSTGEHSAAMAAGALDLRDRRADLAAFCHGLNDSYADAAAAPRRAARGAAGASGAALRRVRADRRAGRRRAVPGDGQLPPPGGARRRRETRSHEPARSRSAQGLMCEELPYDRAVHTPLFAPFAEDLRAIFAAASGARRRRPAVVVHDRRPLPARPRRDPGAARRALDAARSASARRSRRCTTTAPGCSSRSGRAGT